MSYKQNVTSLLVWVQIKSLILSPNKTYKITVACYRDLFQSPSENLVSAENYFQLEITRNSVGTERNIFNVLQNPLSYTTDLTHKLFLFEINCQFLILLCGQIRWAVIYEIRPKLYDPMYEILTN